MKCIGRPIVYVNLSRKGGVPEAEAIQNQPFTCIGRFGLNGLARRTYSQPNCWIL